jgi:hypothetical protein
MCHMSKLNKMYQMLLLWKQKNNALSFFPPKVWKCIIELYVFTTLMDLNGRLSTGIPSISSAFYYFISPKSEYKHLD